MTAAAVIRRLHLQAPLVGTAAAVTAALCLHAAVLPLWVIATYVLLVVWRALLALRGASLPSRPLRYAAAFAIVLGIFATFRTINGLEAGTAMLSLMAGLKLLETRTARDQVVLLLIGYILVLAAFLHEQSLLLVPVYAAIVWLITAALLRATQRPDTLTPRETAAYAARLLLQAAPLMILLFLLFPRVPGPFWGLPEAARAVTGLTDEMSPGDISELSLQSTVAFRVRFEGPVPPPAQRYWRGPVLHAFDGYTWRRPRGVFHRHIEPTFAGPEYSYQLMLEPSGQSWVYALDLPTAWQDPNLVQTHDHLLVAREPLDQPRTIAVRSRTQFRFDGALPASLRNSDLWLGPPAGKDSSSRLTNPHSRDLARRMRAAAADEAQYVRDVLQMFRDQEFYYTLTPPLLDFDSVDDFLFNTRRGFCGHFASAFTFLMRAAQIPARVVTGYQGGEFNRFSGYYLVRQSDAHAWSEVWLAGRGWTRVDPTAFVSPARIEGGLLEALAADEPVPGRFSRDWPLLGNLRFAWDALNTRWREGVVDFGAPAQRSLLRWLGIRDPDWQVLTTLLALSIVVVMALIGLYLRRAMHAIRPDPARRAYLRFCRKLERRGLRRPAHEGALDFAARVARERPDLAEVAAAITRLYIQLRYDAAPASSTLAELQRIVRRFR